LQGLSAYCKCAVIRLPAELLTRAWKIGLHKGIAKPHTRQGIRGATRANDSRLTAKLKADIESVTEAELKHDAVTKMRNMTHDATCKVSCAVAP
jgi:hypothetical protein